MGTNTKEYQLAYKRRTRTKQDALDDAKRHRDRYHYEKKNGKIRKGYELDHVNGVSGSKVRVISKEKNRSLGQKKTHLIRSKKPNYGRAK